MVRQKEMEMKSDRHKQTDEETDTQTHRHTDTQTEIERIENSRAELKNDPLVEIYMMTIASIEIYQDKQNYRRYNEQRV